MIKRDLLGLQSKLAELGGLSVLENDCHFRVPNPLTFKMRPSAQMHEFYLLENEKSFPYQRLSTYITSF